MNIILQKLLNEWKLDSDANVDTNVYDDKSKMERYLRKVKNRAEQEEKMKKWHDGTRGFNIGAAGDAKLRTNYYICVLKGYSKEAANIKKEMNKRGMKVFENRLKNCILDFIND